jgi:tetratricopeptide (TPR) repeat protein
MDARWFSPHQIDWLDRLERELPNLREALEFALSEVGETGLGLAAAMYPLWLSRGMLSEGRRWLDRALNETNEPTVERATALYGAATSAALQGDLPAATAWVAQGQVLVQQTADPIAHAMVALGDGLTALVSGDLDHARTCLDDALGVQGIPAAQAAALLMLGWAHELRGDMHGALVCHEKALALSESHGEFVYRTYALWSIGVAKWREGEGDRAAQLLKQGLELAHLVNDPRMAASCLEALAWIVGEKHNPRVAVVMMGAAETLGHAVGSATVAFPNLFVYHEECERQAREALGAQEFEAAHEEGSSLSFDEAVAYAVEGSTSLTGSARS